MAQITLIVLAAGAGSRFGGAKQLEPFGPGGETLLELNAFDAVVAGVERVVVVTSVPLLPSIERVLRRLPERISGFARVQPSEAVPGGPVRERPWGTAHAVLAAGTPPGPAIIANADDLYGLEAFAAVVRAVSGGTDAQFEDPPRRPPGSTRGAGIAVVAGYRLDRTLSEAGGVSRGVCRVNPSGGLTSIEEVSDLRAVEGRIMGRDGSGRESAYSPDALVSMNLWGLDPSWWPLLSGRLREFLERVGGDTTAEFRLPEAIADEVASGALVGVVPTDADWVGVTYARDAEWVRHEVTRRFTEGRYPSPLFSEVGS